MRFSLFPLEVKFVFIFLMIMMVVVLFLEKLVVLGVFLFLRAATVTLVIAKLINSWFAFITFLIYISGLLVLFGYIMAMRPNSRRFKGRFRLSVVVCGVLLMTGNLLVLPRVSMSFEWGVLKIFSNFNACIYWVMAIVLLIGLIMVVSICFKSPAPLRPFFINV